MLQRYPHSIPAAIAAVMLLLAVGYQPPSFYTGLRIVVPAAAVFTAICVRRSAWPWAAFVFVALAAVWNPILPVYTEREVWFWLDLLGAAAMFAGAWIPRQIPTAPAIRPWPGQPTHPPLPPQQRR